VLVPRGGYRERVAILFKGAGPGSHWWTTDPRISGGFFSPPMVPPSPAAAVRHITAYSHPSPYVSFSASFAVARRYALSGPHGVAMQGQPGYVWEVDTNLAAVLVHDPVGVIAAAQPPLAGAVPRLPAHHDGDQNLILGVAAHSLYGAILTQPPPRVGAAAPFPPVVTPEFTALVYALRDAEVLVERLPTPCIVGRHEIF